MRRFCLYLFLTLATFSTVALGAQRRALVIGNDTYALAPLKNARNDAKSVSSAFHALGYDTTLILDAPKSALEQGVDRFAASLKDGDVAVVYYAGHGMQIDGENYLVPIDFSAANKEDGKAQSYGLSDLLQKVQSHKASTQIIILDACRDNPFLGSRSLHGGWAGVSSSAGSFLAFGTSPGSTAADSSSSGHGVFTASLLKYLTSSQLDIEKTFQLVRQDVISASDGHQIPWTASSLIGSFHINPVLDQPSLPVQASLLTQPANEVASSGQPARGIVNDSHSQSFSMLSTEAPKPISTESRSAADTSTTSSTGAPIFNTQGPTDSPAQNLILSGSLQQIQNGDYDSAERGLMSVLEVDPRVELASRLLSFALTYLNRQRQAVQVLGRAMQVNEPSAQLYFDRCIVGASTNATLAVSDCKQALALDPSFSNGHNGLAAAYMAAHSYDAARQELAAATSAGESATITSGIKRSVGILDRSDTN